MMTSKQSTNVDSYFSELLGDSPLPPEWNNMGQVDMEKKLGGMISSLTLMPPWNSPRYESLVLTIFSLKQYINLTLPDSALEVLEGMANDPDEHILYRCATSYHLYHLSKPQNPMLLKDAQRFCESATAKERKRVAGGNTLANMFYGSSRRVTVGDELDRYKSLIQAEVRYAENPIKCMREKLSGSGIPEGFLPEIFSSKLNHIVRNPRTMDKILGTPEVTSTLVKQIKSLPQEDDVTVYIFKDDDAQMSQTYPPRVKRTYRIFTVDRLKLKDLTERKKKKYQAFKYMTVSMTDYKESEQKAIIGTFAKACLEPYVIMPGSTIDVTPFRPGKVLLENSEEAKHPQVQAFLALMACTSVDFIDPALSVIIHQNKSKILATTKFVIEDAPVLSAISHGLKCMNCCKADMNLLRCTCHKAYFCNKECQTAKWPEHKREHKLIMKKRNARALQNDTAVNN